MCSVGFLRGSSAGALSEFEWGRRTQTPAELDRQNIVSIDTNLDVRPDSMALLSAAREIVEEPGFREVLDSVRKRVDEIESLHRTRELTVCLSPCGLWFEWTRGPDRALQFKDLEEGDVVRLTVDKNGKRKLGGWCWW